MDFNQDGNMANRVNGNASAMAKPNIPMAGAITLPVVETSTNKKPMIGPVHENEVKVMLTYAKSDVSVVSYKIYDTDNKTILGNGDTAFHKVKGKKTANIKIKERLENGKTYLMELSVKQNDKTIRYFTRVIYGTSFHLKECLDFANKEQKNHYVVYHILYV